MLNNYHLGLGRQGGIDGNGDFDDENVGLLSEDKLRAR